MNYVYDPKNQVPITDYNFYFTPVSGVKPLLKKVDPAAAKSPLIFPTKQFTAKCDVAPSLKNLLNELQPLIDASNTGFPAAEQTLEDARPLIGQLDATTAQLTPALQFLGLYKPELTSFFANTVAATQASDPGTGRTRTPGCAPRPRAE